MDLVHAEAFLELVTREENVRSQRLPDDPDAAYDEWLFTDRPFVNDLCVLYLVAIRHDVERRLVALAIRAEPGNAPMGRAEYLQLMSKLVKKDKRGRDSIRWEEIERRLGYNSRANYGSMEVLRFLSNSYKHNPGLVPSKELIECLRLDSELTYATLPESGELQKGLARFLGLDEESPFTEIVRAFVAHAKEFLRDVERHQGTLRRRGWVFSLNPKDSSH